MRFRIGVGILFGAVAAVVWSCGGATEPGTGDGVASVSVNPESFPLSSVGATVRLTASVLGKFGAISNPSVVWSSDAPTIVEVSGSGLSATATARAAGTARITASSGGMSGSSTITVTTLPVATITIADRAFSLAIGGTKTLTALARDAGGGALTDRPIAWSAVNPAVATVTPTGVVTGTGVGTGRIVATSEGKTDTAVVTVSALPTIALSASSLSFTAAANGANPASQVITITNGGSGTLSGISLGAITYEAGATGWLQPLSLSGTTASPSATVSVQPVTGSLAIGTYRATIAVLSTVATNSPQTITVTFTVTAVPLIALSTSNLVFAAPVGGANPLAQTVTITNAGTGTLSGLSVGTITYGAGASGWLGTPSLSGTTANPQITLTVQPIVGTLVAGTYTATIPIVAASATNSPQAITVTFTINSVQGPAIALSSGTLAFNATPGGIL